MMLPIPFVECIWDWNFLKGNESSSSSLLSHNPPFCFEVLCLLLLFLCFLDSVGREVYSLSVSLWNSMWVKGLGFRVWGMPCLCNAYMYVPFSEW